MEAAKPLVDAVGLWLQPDEKQGSGQKKCGSGQREIRKHQ
jgi:hypothetical protein